MNRIHSDYLVNQQTIALLPSRKIEYQTVVLEDTKQILVRKPMLEIVKDSCLHYCSTYEGRRKAVMHHTGFKRKVPIPISINKGIYTFPTHSPTDYSCSWIFYNHVEVVLTKSQIRNIDVQTLINFKNNIRLPLDISHTLIEKQLERTEVCMLIFSEDTIRI